MGMLQRKGGLNAEKVYLQANHLVGRWDGCQLVISRREVSAQHASITWMGGHWQLRDLASRNGTLHKATPLGSNDARELQVGDEILFGDRDEKWVVCSVDAPGLLLTPTPDSSGDQIYVHPDSTIVPLPSPEAPTITLMCDSVGRWMIESDDMGCVPLPNNHVVEFGGNRYHAYVPLSSPHTVESSTPLIEHSLDFASFQIGVSADEETADVRITVGTVSRHIRESTPLYLLAYLGRERIQDWERRKGQWRTENPHLGEHYPEQLDIASGWVETERACRELGVSREQLGVQVFRVRADLKEQGFDNSVGIIERRRGWVRIGVRALKIQVLRRY